MENRQESQTQEEIGDRPRSQSDEEGPYDQAVSALIGLLLFGLIAFTPWYFFGSRIGIWITVTPMAVSVVGVLGLLVAALVFGWTGGKISKPPGFVAHRFLSRVLTRRVYKSQFGDLIEQARQDHAEALAESDHLQTKLVIADLNIRIAGRIVAAIATLPLRLIATVLKIPFVK